MSDDSAGGGRRRSEEGGLRIDDRTPSATDRQPDGRSDTDDQSSMLHPRSSLRSAAADFALYGTQFWLAYLANFLLTTANSLTFRFADFVHFLQEHGSARTTGLIVGVGTGVSVLMRIWLGRVIDRRGPRWTWLISSAAFAVGCLAFVAIQSVGPAIYFVRIVYACGIAGMFSCSVIHLCTDVPVERRAELIGSLGTSGFLGMIVGPQIGDWIFRMLPAGRGPFAAMFLAAASMGVGYLVLVIFLSRHAARPEPHEPPPLVRLLVRHWPGTVVAVAMMMGIAYTVPFTFLTRFRDEQGLAGIGVYFLFYAPTAILMRVLGRRWPEQLGRRPAALIGLTCVAVSMLLYLPVETEWQLALPALAAGTGHALLFPSVTTLGAESFPERYRGTGTTFILGFVDAGALCGAPVLGALIDGVGFDAMFLTAAIVITTVAVAFAAASFIRARQHEREADVAPVPTGPDLGEW